MGLESTLRDLQGTVSRYPHEYAAGRARHPALAAYESPAALLDALRRLPRDADDARGNVLAALIAEHKRSVRPLWQTLLLTVFAPMLRGLRKHLGKKGDEDLDQRVLLAFLQALRCLSPRLEPRFIPIALRRLVAHTLFDQLTVEHLAPRFEELEAARHVPAPAEETMDASEAELTRLLDAAAIGEELRDVLVATAGDESLTEYVDRVHASLDARGRRVVYDRLRRERASALAQLRVEVTGRAAA